MVIPGLPVRVLQETNDMLKKVELSKFWMRLFTEV